MSADLGGCDTMPGPTVWPGWLGGSYGLSGTYAKSHPAKGSAGFVGNWDQGLALNSEAV